MTNQPNKEKDMDQGLREELFEELKKEISEGLREVTNESIEKLEKLLIEKINKVIALKNEEMKKVMKEMNEKLEEERCEVEILEDTNSALDIKERQNNEEIHEAHKELIKGLGELSGDRSSTIGVKRMGEIDTKPFLKVCEQRFSGGNVKLQQVMLFWKWEETLKDPAWHPFKLVGTGKKNEVVDEEDEKLKNLRKDWGDEVENAVKTAIVELHEANPSGRYPFPVLWNFEQDRKATLKEGIAHMTKEIKTLKRKAPMSD